MEEKQEVTPEFIHYMKERDAALEEVKATQKELRETQSKLYDSMVEIEDLEKKLAVATGKKGKKNAANKKKTTVSATPSVNGTKSTDGLQSAQSVPSSATRTGTRYHPPFGEVDSTTDSYTYYWKIAETFPNLPMLTALEAEKKFIQADTDNSGTIDNDELDKVLTATVGMMTQKQIDEIFKEVDTDGSDFLDFKEVLTIVNKLSSRRKTNLPQSVQQSYSKTCNLQ